MRTFVGIVAALVAVYAGGCGAVFFVQGINAAMAGEVGYGPAFYFLALAVVPTVIAGLIAWWALIKWPGEDVSGDRE